MRWRLVYTDYSCAMLWEVADSWVGRTDGLSLAGRVVVVAVGFVEYLWLLLCRALIGNNVPHTGLLPPGETSVRI